MNDRAPRLIAAIGLHGAASTWAYNVVRELMLASFGEAHVRATYADLLKQLHRDERALVPRCLIVKSHQGSTEIDSWLADNGARIVLSLRDPRDAAVSMAQRFKRPLDQTVQWLLHDCARAAAILGADPFTLRYEDRPFDDLAAVRALAEALDSSPPAAEIDAIFARYRPEAVRDFARDLANLPPERVKMIASFKMDRVTQILETHIGDTRSGKWHDLPAPAPERLTRAFGRYLGPLGYSG